MKILSIEHALPARRITNDWVLEQVRIHNRETLSPSELELVEARLTRFLASAGTEVRYAVEKDERALDLCLNAGRAALATAGVGPNEIDFVLYVGVCRGWTEPAMANVVQAELGLGNATCFDIVDACASWLRALHVAHAYLRGGIYRRGLIVNCECAFVPYQYWTLATVDELDYRAAGWTAAKRHGHRRDDDITDDDFYFTFKISASTTRSACSAAMRHSSGRTPSTNATPHASSHSPSSWCDAEVIETYKADPVSASAARHRVGHETASRAAHRTARLPYDHYVSTRAASATPCRRHSLGMSIASKRPTAPRRSRARARWGVGITVELASFTFWRSFPNTFV
jgi:hypothetical protein